MTRPRRHQPASDEQRTHLMITLPANDAQAVVSVLIEQFGFAEISENKFERPDGSKASVV